MEMDRKYKFAAAAAFNALAAGVFFIFPQASEFMSEEVLILLQGVVNTAIIGIIKDKS